MAIITIKYDGESDKTEVSTAGHVFMKCKGYELDAIVEGLNEALHYYGAMLPKIRLEEAEL